MGGNRPLSTSIVLITLLSLNFLIQSASSDILTGQVQVPNSPPEVNLVNLHDADGGTIQLIAGSDTNVLYCDAVILDLNGFGDINASWGYIFNASGMAASPDLNERYDNGSCSTSGGSGTTIFVNCSFVVAHQAMNGTWTCNISVNDSADAVSSNLSTNTIDELTAISVLESTLDFGVMALGSASTDGNITNITNQGNVIVDIRVNGTDYVCTGQGTITVNNTRYNASDSAYAAMTMNLTYEPTTELNFDLGVQGIITADNVNATKNEYWTIAIPATGVSGTCQNNIQITGTYDS